MMVIVMVLVCQGVRCHSYADENGYDNNDNPHSNDDDDDSDGYGLGLSRYEALLLR